MTELKPCPLCGGKPKGFEYTKIITDGYTRVHVRFCSKCRYYVSANTEEECDEEWNRRVNDG